MLSGYRVQLALISDASETAVTSDHYSFIAVSKEKCMSSLTINKRQVNGVVIVDLDGKISLGESNTELHESLRQLVAEGKRNVILNLAKVTAIDSSGLGSIVAGYSTLQAAGGSLKLINLPERVSDLMTITKLYTVFDIYDNEAAGINSFETSEEQVTGRLDEAATAGAKAGSSLL
jgi:anti-sigma B factor antagonist